MFTTQHYEALASEFYNALDRIDHIKEETGMLRVINRVMDMLERDNPKFNRAKFHDAAFPSNRPKYDIHTGYRR